MAEERGRFIGVGVDHYIDRRHDNLDHPVAEVEAMRRLLKAEFEGDPLANPTFARVSDYLRSVSLDETTGPLVMFWSGHGVVYGGGLTLLVSDSEGDRDGVLATDVVRRCATTGAPQLLFIVDSCHAAAALPDAHAVATAIWNERPPDADLAWFGVLVSCAAADTGARDGAFGRFLLHLLQTGPTTPDQRRRWSSHNRLIQGEDLGAAALAEWSSSDQRPDFLRQGAPLRILPNPLYRQDAPEQVVEHLLRAARGGDDLDTGFWFTGRTAEVNTVVDWVTAGSVGVRMLTGSAGTGKSAIVGRVVSVANPAERKNIGVWEHADPGLGTVTAHVHARGLTPDGMAHRLDESLVRRGVLPPMDADARNAAELVGAVQRAVENGHPPPVLVVDGLDEARGYAFEIATELLVRLAPYANIVVSSRPLSRAELPSSITEALDAVAVLDLDEPELQESGRAALHRYVVARLRDRHPAMDPQAVADAFVGDSSGTEDRPFLLARVVTDQLRAEPIDTSTERWSTELSGSIEAAFDADLHRIEPPATLPDGLGAGDLAEALVTALTWPFGAGFPEEEWLSVASALCGTQLDRDHISWLLDGLGRYVVQDGEFGVAVYRLAHQSIADHVRPVYQYTAEQPFDAAATPVTAALLTRYEDLLTAGVAAEAPEYLWMYAWRHAAEAGPEGLALFRNLVATTPELAGDMGLAAGEVSGEFGFWGFHAKALALVEEAVELLRTHVADHPDWLPELARTLNELSFRYGRNGRHAQAVACAEEAVDLRRRQAEEDRGYLPELALALSNLGQGYRDVGRRPEAIVPTAEALDLYRALAAENPIHLSGLALTLNNLSHCYSGVGRYLEAIALEEESIAVRRTLAGDDSAHLLDLALALNNLGQLRRDVGRYADAVASAEEAVALYRDQADDNPAYRPDLARALNNLGLCLHDIGRRDESIALMEESVALRRTQAADNPAYRPDLAGCLTNLGQAYRDVGRHAEAVAPSEEAVGLLREASAENSGLLPDFAVTLSNLGLCYSDVGRPQDAVTPIEQAVSVYRTLVVDNPVHRASLALALTNLSGLFAELARTEDARACAEEAVALYRVASLDNPAHLPPFAAALVSLGSAYSLLGRTADAIVVAEEAADVLRAQSAEIPEDVLNLAGVLNTLALARAALGRRTEAVAAAEEAVDIYRANVAEGSHRYSQRALVTNTLGILYRAEGRYADAVAPLSESIAFLGSHTEENPAYLVLLSAALHGLGISLLHLGRRAQAVVALDEAVVRYRGMAADNPAVLQPLAQALSEIESVHAEDGRAEMAESLWRETLTSIPPAARVVVLVHRASTAVAGDQRAAGWLAEALENADVLENAEALATDTAHLVAPARAQARRHRDAGGHDWAAAWQRRTGELPDWLEVDRPLLATATAWATMRDVATEREYLLAHPELLEPAADVAMSEALLGALPDVREWRRALRSTARADGVAAAYQDLVARALAERFRNAAPAEQRELLAESAEELQTVEVIDYLAARGDGAAVRAAAVLSLAAVDQQGTTISAALDALEGRGSLAALLASTARSDDAALLGPVATVGIAAATGADELASAVYHFAVAAAMVDDPVALRLLRKAVELDPSRRSAWIADLADLARKHPGVLALIPALTTDESA